MARSTFKGPIRSENGVEIGTSGTQLTFVKKGTVSINPSSISAGAVGEETITITGAVVGDEVILHPPAAGLTAGLVVCDARVSAADTVKVRLFNSTGAPIDEAAASWIYVLIRS